MLGRAFGSIFGMNDQKDNAYVRFYINSDAWASECILLI